LTFGTKNLNSVSIYSHALLNDGDTFSEMSRWAISSLCEHHRVLIQNQIV